MTSIKSHAGGEGGNMKRNMKILALLATLFCLGCSNHRSVDAEGWEECVSLCNDRGVQKLRLNVIHPDFCYCNDGARYIVDVD